MYNVLHILTGEDGGITATVRNYYNNLDREKIHFDLACITEGLGNDVKAMSQIGAEVFRLPMKSLSVRNYTLALKEILSRKKYDAVHVHESQTSFVALKTAKRMGIKCRVAHSHTSAPYISIGNEIRRLAGICLNYHYATALIACGVLSGERVFGKKNMKRKKAIVLHNSVDLERFAYDSKTRDILREEFDISDRYVIGLIGRLAKEKNQIYALKIVKELHKSCPNAVLILAGDGEEKAVIDEYIQKNNMQEYVFLLGKREDPERIYQMLDIMILPSVHEGFPLVAIEALASGLKVLLSAEITNELSFSKRVKYIDLHDEREWVNSLKTVANETCIMQRTVEASLYDFDIKKTAKKLESIYLNDMQ